jgi:hypothetical protein
MIAHVSRLPGWVDHPILIYGPRKSGTTLLYNLLDGHPNLVVYPAEAGLSALLSTAQFPAGEAAIDFFYTRSKVLRKVAQRGYSGFNLETYRAHITGAQTAGITNLRDLLRYDAYGMFKAIAGPADRDLSGWAVKSVGQRPRPVLRSFRALFFEGKVILLVRDPLLVTRSILTDRRRRKIRMPFKEKLKHVFDPVLILHEQRAMLGTPGAHLLAYEHLVADVRAEMQAVCSFLGIPYANSCERPSVCGVPVIVSTASQQTPEVFQHGKKWHEDLTFSDRLAIVIGHFLLWLYGLARRRKWAHYETFLGEIRSSRAKGTTPSP